jgi:hypothetical protein
LQKGHRFYSAIFYLNAKAVAANDAALAIIPYHVGSDMIHCSGLRDRRHTIDGPAECGSGVRRPRRCGGMPHGSSERSVGSA